MFFVRSMTAPITIGVPVGLAVFAPFAAPPTPSPTPRTATSATATILPNLILPPVVVVGRRTLRAADGSPTPRAIAARPRRASSPAGTSQSEPSCALPNVPLSEKISRSYSPCQPASSSAASTAGTSATPSPGSTRSAQLRVGLRTSETWTPAKRPTSRPMSSSRVGVFQRCHDVELEPERRMAARGLDQLDRLGDRGRDRPLLAAVALVRLERDRDAGQLRLGGERAQAVGDDRARVVGIEAEPRAGQADDAARAEGREPVDRRAERVDALGRIGRPAEPRQRQDRRHERHRRRGLEPAPLEGLERARVVAAFRAA